MPEKEVDDGIDTFNLDAELHRGQYALRKLYHESDRLIAVLYTAPTCGPCRFVALCVFWGCGGVG